MDIFLVKPKFAIREELAIYFSVKTEQTLLDSQVKKFFYLINTNTFIPEEKMFSYMEDFSRIKGFDIEDFVEKSDKNFKQYQKIHGLLINAYLLDVISNNLHTFDTKLMVDDSKGITAKKVDKKEQEIRNSLLEELKKMIPPYYVRYYKFMEEFKDIEEWEKFYNIVVEDISMFDEHISSKTDRNYQRFEFLKRIQQTTYQTSDRLNYDLKTYFTEPK